MRPSKNKVLEQFRTCVEELGKIPGQAIFLSQTGLTQGDYLYYWARFSDLVREAGFQPNVWTQAIPDNELWEAMARVCIRLQKYPTLQEHRIVARELRLPVYEVYTGRFGRTAEIKQCFKEWIENAPEEFQCILTFPGWETLQRASRTSTPIASQSRGTDASYPFLPDCLQYLELLSKGQKPYEHFAENVNTAFEKRCGDAFRCLGFDVQELGQGRGRKADSLALAREDGFGIIIDAKVRTNGYVLGTEDRKFLEYAMTHSKELQRAGIPKIYLAVVGSEFRDNDLDKLTAYLAQSPVRSAVFITAEALMRIVEGSIRDRHKFRLTDIDRLLFGNKVIRG